MRSAVRLAAFTLVCLALLVAGAWWRGVTWSDLQHWGTPRNVVEIEGQTVRIPAPEGDAERLLAEVPVTTQGVYEFLFPTGGEGGGPVRYDPCRPVEWVLSPRLMPAAVEPLVDRAVARVEEATGLDFVAAGTTDEIVSFGRPLVQDRYGDGFAPLVIGFSTEAATPDLAGTVTGLGGSTAVAGAYGEARFLRAGVVVLDAEDLARVAEEPGGEDLVEAVIAHELGHVVGLAHVADTGELMHEANLRLLDWGPGDRAGLAIAGAGGCEQP